MCSAWVPVTQASGSAFRSIFRARTLGRGARTSACDRHVTRNQTLTRGVHTGAAHRAPSAAYQVGWPGVARLACLLPGCQSSLSNWLWRQRHDGITRRGVLLSQVSARGAHRQSTKDHAVLMSASRVRVRSLEGRLPPRTAGSRSPPVKGSLLLDEPRPGVARARHRHGKGGLDEGIRCLDTLLGIEASQLSPPLLFEEASSFCPLFDVSGLLSVRRHLARIARDGVVSRGRCLRAAVASGRLRVPCRSLASRSTPRKNTAARHARMCSALGSRHPGLGLSLPQRFSDNNPGTRRSHVGLRPTRHAKPDAAAWCTQPPILPASIEQEPRTKNEAPRTTPY